MSDGDGVRGDLSGLPLADLLARSHALACELSSRLSDPRLVDSLPPLRTVAEDRDHPEDWGLYAHADRPGCDSPADSPAAEVTVPTSNIPGELSGPAGSLAELQVGVEDLARVIDSARTALAGHTDRIFEAHGLREELLGIPPGKCAFRNGAEFLRDLLRIGRREARSRIFHARHTMASLTLDHATVVEADMPALAEAVQGAELGGAAVDLIVTTVADARREAVLADVPPDAVNELLAHGEALLVAQARDVDPDTLRKICAHWRLRFEAAVNPDGSEPTEAQLNATQGLFYRGRTKGLHEWNLWADDAQHEMLKTVVSEGSNPRRSLGDTADQASTQENCRTEGWNGLDDRAATLDGRSRARRELDSLVSALTGALALVGVGSVPEASRTRPQVMAVIDYETLFERFGQDPPGTDGAAGPSDGRPPDARPPDARPPVGRPPGGTAPPRSPNGRISTSSYVGDINPQTIRRLACEADLIPVVLGGGGEVLDVGRSRRLFTPRLRRAITARDGGCTAPGCSIPAPWCEAHHVWHWEDGGPTSVDNGTLLCSHHHHAVHAGAWRISVWQGIPWFVPARYLDPDRRPRRNLYWRPGLAAS